MSNANDARILEMKKQIEKKKEELGVASRFNPITNCSFELDDERYNINALSKEKLVLLAVKLQAYLIAAKTLELAEIFELSGYHVSDWISDIMQKLQILKRTDEAKNLKVMEDKLGRMLSETKKVELEIDDIASFLNS